MNVAKPDCITAARPTLFHTYRCVPKPFDVALVKLCPSARPSGFPPLHVPGLVDNDIVLARRGFLAVVGRSAAVWLAIGGYLAAQTGQPLDRDHAIQIMLAPGQIHTYTIQASARTYFRILIAPNGNVLGIRLLAPDGAELTTAVNEAGEQRPLSISQIVSADGAYRVELHLTDPEAARRSYGIHLEELREAVPGDEQRVAAERLFQEGKKLQIDGAKESLQQAISKLEASLPLWRAISDKAQEAHTLDTMGDVYWAIGQPGKANTFYKQALPLAKASADRAGEASVLSNLGVVSASFGGTKPALEFYEQSLQLSRAAGDHNLEATTLNNIGSVYTFMGDPRKALGYATRALELKRETGDRQGEVTALSNLGSLYAALSEPQKALEALNQALPIRRKLHDQHGEVFTLLNLASAYSQLAELTKANDTFNQSLVLSRAVGDRRAEAAILVNLGVGQMALGAPQEALEGLRQGLDLTRELNNRYLEETALTNIARAYLQLGEPVKALDFSNQALAIQRKISDKRGEALALVNLGGVLAANGDSQKALESYQQALPLLRAAADQANEAETLGDIGTLLLKRGEAQKARTCFEEAMDLANAASDPRRRAVNLSNLGAAWLALGERDNATASLTQAVSELSAIGDRMQQARALYLLARADKDSTQALGHLDQALRINEDIRADVLSADLRSSYFGTVLEGYDLRVNLLMSLHRQQPGGGFDRQAFETSERARARSLMDLLAEARADIRQGVDPALLARDRSLHALLHAKTERQIGLLAGKHESQSEAVEREIRALATEDQELEAQIRAASPRYAALVQPQPLTLHQIRQEVLDPHSMLLEYMLGDDHSFLWAVTTTSFRSYLLPGRVALEDLARRAYEGLSSTNPDAAAQVTPVLQDLSRALIGPVAGQMTGRRLMVVAPGALQYVPFGALPLPGAGTPLIASHEIVNLPSASTLALMRRDLKDRPQASKLLAVLADPVFSAQDPRVQGSPKTNPASATFNRIPSTRKEAEQILALAPRGDNLRALDFDASRSTVMSGALRQYRFIHIASHGLLNTLHPELSGIALSLVDREGRPQNGFLEMHDVYNLSLGADLVVLSACETALGKEVKGEGLVGLSRGFMYAGAPRIVASLWAVPDLSTAELMTRFYRNMLVDGMRPAAALRQAQVSLWKDGHWARPYYWAAFTIEGEWR